MIMLLCVNSMVGVHYDWFKIPLNWLMVWS